MTNTYKIKLWYYNYPDLKYYQEVFDSKEKARQAQKNTLAWCRRHDILITTRVLDFPIQPESAVLFVFRKEGDKK